jgi:hypothetical protein
MLSGLYEHGGLWIFSARHFSVQSASSICIISTRLKIFERLDENV